MSGGEREAKVATLSRSEPGALERALAPHAVGVSPGGWRTVQKSRSAAQVTAADSGSAAAQPAVRPSSVAAVAAR